MDAIMALILWHTLIPYSPIFGATVHCHISLHLNFPQFLTSDARHSQLYARYPLFALRSSPIFFDFHPVYTSPLVHGSW